MVKIVLIVIYLLIGLFFAGQSIGVVTNEEWKEKHVDDEHPWILLVVVLVVSISELVAWPAMIALTAGFSMGRKKDD